MACTPNLPRNDLRSGSEIGVCPYLKPKWYDMGTLPTLPPLTCCMLLQHECFIPQLSLKNCLWTSLDTQSVTGNQVVQWQFSWSDSSFCNLLHSMVHPFGTRKMHSILFHARKPKVNIVTWEMNGDFLFSPEGQQIWQSGNNGTESSRKTMFVYKHFPTEKLTTPQAIDWILTGVWRLGDIQRANHEATYLMQGKGSAWIIKSWDKFSAPLLKWVSRAVT